MIVGGPDAPQTGLFRRMSAQNRRHHPHAFPCFSANTRDDTLRARGAGKLPEPIGDTVALLEHFEIERYFLAVNIDDAPWIITIEIGQPVQPGVATKPKAVGVTTDIADELRVRQFTVSYQSSLKAAAIAEGQALIAEVAHYLASLSRDAAQCGHVSPCQPHQSHVQISLSNKAVFIASQWAQQSLRAESHSALSSLVM